MDILPLVAVQPCSLQQRQHAQNAVEGGPQFVAHIGQKLTFPPVGFFRRVVGGSEVVCQFLQGNALLLLPVLPPRQAP